MITAIPSAKVAPQETPSGCGGVFASATGHPVREEAPTPVANRTHVFRMCWGGRQGYRHADCTFAGAADGRPGHFPDRLYVACRSGRSLNQAASHSPRSTAI